MRLLACAAAVSLRVPRTIAGQSGRIALDALPMKLAACVDARRSARIVGLEYLRGVPAESDMERLTTLIRAGLAKGDRDLARAEISELKELLERQQRQDFATDRIVDVDGWILARTEARLYALVALVGQP